MADIEQEKELLAEPKKAIEADTEDVAVSESEEALDAEPDDEPSDYEEPPRPLTQKEYIREQMRLSRLEWFEAHKTVLFIAVGIVLAALIFVGIRIYNANNNPATWLVQSFAKDFGTSFDYEVTLSEDGAPAMKYDGSIENDRGERSIEAMYDADYGTYAYTGALHAEGDKAVRGTLYDGKWTVGDCSEQMNDFFTLDKSLRNGSLDAGALLRFLGMTSDISSAELDRFSKRLKGLMSSESVLASVSAERVEGGTRYTYEISVGELFRILVEDGAPLFFNSSDYNAFKERYEANKRSLQNKICKMSYVIDYDGYLAVFGMEIEADDTVYALDCRMSRFGKAEVELPTEFLEAAGLTEKE